MSERPLWRTALFPLILVAALVWLGVQTLGGDDESGQRRVTFSRVLQQVRSTPEALQSVTFHPSTQEVEVTYQDGTTAKTAYPVDQSAFALQQLLEEKQILFDAKRTASSGWWEILTSLLPFVLLFGFWIFLTRNMRKDKGQPPTGSEPVRTF